ncbi:low temperature requirement protein A [Micromonospora sp. 4G57]|uniref:Low temperature requirement protein A n=1 Tax=Micromonospora sicca TaxID=2202420 RepID=A0A317DQW1_9ACTN|nr:MULTISPECIES: low temperature requirement protein A [unclassified Micromonospora]MBM0226714.1 low temperature requirement protein A [Micromonospora sp. ATA51]MDZ5443611.1 low temperature requirement protein A [Micromonospora sp. 4G57]PWR17139.1 hypothetical protein DKT69_01765 [Micromonospora sp. 4G51]
MSPAAPDTAARVTAVEIFFDVVFVFIVTQLAHVLEDDLTWAGFGRTVLILGLLWYPYTGYAWLTNHVPPDAPPRRSPSSPAWPASCSPASPSPPRSPTPACSSPSATSSSTAST